MESVFVGEAMFLLMTPTPDVKVKLLMISFSTQTYFAYESATLSYINSFDDTSLDAYGFLFELNAVFFGTMTDYFDTPLT